jgi:hypothetical protein
MQDQPDQSTVSMGNRPDGLIMPQARDRAAVHDLEDEFRGPVGPAGQRRNYSALSVFYFSRSCSNLLKQCPPLRRSLST